jgi:nitrogen fixation protein FixH
MSTSSASPAPAAGQRPSRSRRWAYIFIGLLTFHAGSMIAMVIVATSDPSFAVEPNYYEQALNWNSAAEQSAQNQRLGWSAAVATGDLTSPAGGDAPARELRVTLTDQEGRPLDGAVVHVECFHHARSGDRTSAQLAAAGGGLYAASLPLTRPGLWEVRITVERGPERFTQRTQVDIAAGASTSGPGEGAP